jgi:glutamine amidotransferase
MLVIIDYDGGNTKSVANALKKCSIEFKVSNDHKLIESAQKLILPGVSNFSYCMKELKKKVLIN